MEKEVEIITCEELYEKIEDKNKFPYQKIILKCAGCKKIDILYKFVVRHNFSHEKDTPYFAAKEILQNKFLYCPKCKSSIIGLAKEYNKNNILYFLEDGKN